MLFASGASACPTINGLIDIQCDGKILVVTFGDSITQGYLDPARLGYPGRLSKLMPKISVANLGLHGENTYNGRFRAMRELDNFPDADYIIILEGTNDFYDETPNAEEAAANVKSMIASAKATGAKVLVGNLTATKRGFQRSWVYSVNKVYRAFTSINFYALGEDIIGFDGIHPTRTGYEEMAVLVRHKLKALAKVIKPKDSDKDGLYDYEETRLKTSNRKSDTDGDGLSDGKEVWKYKTDPLKADTDGDGLSDGDEINLYHTNPLIADIPTSR